MSNIYQAPLPKWLSLRKYHEISGRTSDAMHGKIRQGKIIEGFHWKKDPDGAIMINWSAMDEWVENGFKAASGH